MAVLRNVRPSRKVESKNRARIQRGLCIIESCPCPYKSHGLCIAHNNQFQYRRTAIAAKQGREEADKWEHRQYVNGLALTNQTQREYARKEDVA